MHGVALPFVLRLDPKETLSARPCCDAAFSCRRAARKVEGKTCDGNPQSLLILPRTLLLAGGRSADRCSSAWHQPRNQTWIDLLWHQGWLRFWSRERLRLPALSRNRRNAPRPPRRAMEYIREARCDLRPQAIKPGWPTFVSSRIVTVAVMPDKSGTSEWHCIDRNIKPRRCGRIDCRRSSVP